VEMAKNAGIDAIGVSYGVHAEERLYDSGAMYVCESFDEVTQWLLPRVTPAFGEFDDRTIRKWRQWTCF